jgi:hypothetical protein
MIAIYAGKTPIIWMLITSLAHMPVPWVHCHSDPDCTELASHLQCYHEDAQSMEWELGGGWHIHWLCQDCSSEDDGFTADPPMDQPLAKCEQMIFDQATASQWLRRVKSSGQHATSNLSNTIRDGEFVPASYQRQTRWRTTRDGFDTCSLFCVLLI